MSSIIESISTFMERSGFSIITLIFVAVFGLISVRCILKILKHSLLQTSLDKLLIKFVMTIAKIFLYVLLLLYCFTIVGIPLTGAVTALSATDEDGNDSQFELLGELDDNGTRYMAMTPIDEETDEYVILKVTVDENGEEIVVTIDDDDEFERIADAFDDIFAGE